MALTAERPGVHSSLHLVYSFECNLSCDHCISRAGPDDSGTMGIPRAKAFIEQAGQAGIRRIVFTGGEPLLHAQDVRILIEHAFGEGMESVLITNVSWVSSRHQAKECLSDLKQIGLQSITLSTDRYHLREVPLEKLECLLDVAREIGLQAGVKIARLAHDPVADGLYRSLRADSTRILVQEISPLGRAAPLRRALKLRVASSFSRPGCFTPPVLLVDGCLLTCCNLPARDIKQTDYPFALGNADDDPLPSLLYKRSGDPILNALRHNGPSTLLARLARKESAFREQYQRLYHSGCVLCFHLFCRLPDKAFLYSALERQRNEKNDTLWDPL